MPTNMALLLLAQAEEQKPGKLIGVELNEVSKHVNKGIQHDLPWELLLAGIGATLVTIVAISLRRWWQSRHTDPSPLVLFSAIARRAGLGWRDRYLLWRMAKTFALPTPITLMLSRGTLRHYGDLYLNSQSAGSHRRNGKRLADIELVLFD